jgi:hypothetical protein
LSSHPFESEGAASAASAEFPPMVGEVPNVERARSSTSLGPIVSSILPHLSESPVGDERASRLVVVRMPKVTKSQTSLSPAEKVTATSSRHHWPLGTQLHPDDLPWVLEHWLSDGSLGVPYNESGSQDCFIKLKGHIIAVAFKMVGSTSPLDWALIREEYDKMPSLQGSGLACTLAVYAANVSESIAEVMGDRAAITYRAGQTIKYRGAKVGLIAVDPGRTVVVVNPNHPNGLTALLGQWLRDRIIELSATARKDEILRELVRSSTV